MSLRTCVGCGKEFQPLHRAHRWHDNGCYVGHFDREHPGQQHLRGMQPLGMMGDRKAIRAFVRKFT